MNRDDVNAAGRAFAEALRNHRVLAAELAVRVRGAVIAAEPDSTLPLRAVRELAESYALVAQAGAEWERAMRLHGGGR